MTLNRKWNKDAWWNIWYSNASGNKKPFEVLSFSLKFCCCGDRRTMSSSNSLTLHNNPQIKAIKPELYWLRAAQNQQVSKTALLVSCVTRFNFFCLIYCCEMAFKTTTTIRAQIYEWRVCFGSDISGWSAAGDRRKCMSVWEKETETKKTRLARLIAGFSCNGTLSANDSVSWQMTCKGLFGSKIFTWNVRKLVWQFAVYLSTPRYARTGTPVNTEQEVCKIYSDCLTIQQSWHRFN